MIWLFGHNCIIDWPGKCLLRAIALNSFSLRVASLHMLANINCMVNIIDYSAIHLCRYQFFFYMCFNINTVECHFNLLPRFYTICVKYTLKYCTLWRKRISLNLHMSFSTQNTFLQSNPRNTSMDHAVWVWRIFFVIHFGSLDIASYPFILETYIVNMGSHFALPAINEFCIFHHCSMNLKCNLH